MAARVLGTPPVSQIMPYLAEAYRGIARGALGCRMGRDCCLEAEVSGGPVCYSSRLLLRRC